MATEVKVRHALVNYTASLPNGQKYQEVAFRGAIIKIEDSFELDRLTRLGAIIDPKADLDRPGRLMDLPDSATDEEILAWVTNASQSEVRKLAASRPVLVDRLVGASQQVEDQRRRTDELLGIKTRIDEALEHVPERPAFTADGIPTGADPGTSAGVQQGVGGSANVPHDAVPLSDTPGATHPEGTATGDTGGPGTAATAPVTPAEPGAETEPEAFSKDQADAVVRGNATSVVNWISEHPQHAASILEAENRHAAAGNNDGQPRITVIRAVEAAAGHTQ